MNHGPVFLSAALALTVPAFATGGGGLETCEPGELTYEMSNYNTGSTARVIWAPNLFCSGKTALLSMQPGGELWHNDDLTDGGFTGKAKVVSGGCGTFDGTVWDVSFDLAPKASNTVAKSPRGDWEDWKIMLVENGEMRRLGHLVSFTNYPTDLKHGNQIGVGANPIDSASEFGGAFWFKWTRYTVTVDSDTGEEVKCKVAHGTGDFNYDLEVTCEPGSECPVEPDSPLGPATGFNVYTTSWMNVWNSDIGGATAVGGWGKVSNYGLNSAGGGGTVLSVKGSFTGTNSQLYGGDGEAGGTCSLTSFGTPDGDMTCSVSGVFDAGSAANVDALDDILDWTAAQGVGGTSASLNEWWPQLIIDGDANDDLNVVNVDTCAVEAAITAKWPWASDIQGWDIQGKAGSTLVINLFGDCGDMFFKNGYMAVSGVSRTNIVWVAHDLTALDIKNVSLQGSLLAPHTAVTFNSANIDGQMIAKTLKGTGESHEFSFDGDICP